MEALINYLAAVYATTSEVQLSNEKLLELFGAIYPNHGITKSMRGSEKIRDTHIRYQVWKLLPDEMRKVCTQNLELKEKEDVKAEDDPSGEKEPVGEVKTEDDPSGEDEAVGEVKTEDESGLKISLPEQGEPTEEVKAKSIDEATIQKAQHVRQRSALANKLYDIEDAKERAEIIAAMDVHRDKIKELDNIIKGEEPSKLPKIPTYIKPMEQVAKMTAGELKSYKATLMQNRSKNQKKLEQKPQDKLSSQWQADLDLINQILQDIG